MGTKRGETEARRGETEARRGETQLTLRIDLAADPITGSLETAPGEGRRFLGWIGLAAALEAVRGEPAQEPRPAARDGAG